MLSCSTFNIQQYLKKLILSVAWAKVGKIWYNVQLCTLIIVLYVILKIFVRECVPLLVWRHAVEIWIHTRQTGYWYTVQQRRPRGWNVQRLWRQRYIFYLWDKWQRGITGTRITHFIIPHIIDMTSKEIRLIERRHVGGREIFMSPSRCHVSCSCVMAQLSASYYVVLQLLI